MFHLRLSSSSCVVHAGEYVEYLSEQVNKEYAFLQSKCLDPMLDQHMPPKQSAAFKKSMNAAKREQQSIDAVLEVSACVLCYATKYL